MAITHPTQRGFLQGRKILANALDTQMALEEAVMLGQDPCAVVLFDVFVAFPSVECEWIWRCLHGMGVPGWLSRGLRATYDDTCMMVMFNEAVYSD